MAGRAVVRPGPADAVGQDEQDVFGRERRRERLVLRERQPAAPPAVEEDRGGEGAAFVPARRRQGIVAPARDLAQVEAGAGSGLSDGNEAAAQKDRGPDPPQEEARPPGQTRRVGPVVVVVSATGAVSTSAARAKPK
jgi:hypothetical protein